MKWFLVKKLAFPSCDRVKGTPQQSLLQDLVFTLANGALIPLETESDTNRYKWFRPCENPSPFSSAVVDMPGLPVAEILGFRTENYLIFLALESQRESPRHHQLLKF